MIGGYVYRRRDASVQARLQAATAGFRRVEVPGCGYLFCTGAFKASAKPWASSGRLAAVTEDLLVGRASDGAYRLEDLETEFLPRFGREARAAFDSIQSDFRIAVISGRQLYLASNRAGSGRIYYRKLADGIVFCSDLRFLAGLAPFEASRKAVYALLKYGFIPDPLTIAREIWAVPAAHCLTYNVDTGADSVEPYFQFSFPADRPDESFDEANAFRRVEDVLSATARLLGEFEPAMLLSGGIDSSLYGCCLHREKPGSFRAYYCSFGKYDPEYRHALAIAGRLETKLDVAVMKKADALQALDDVVRLTDHPFSDFSSLPVTFLLKYIQERESGNQVVIECNGADDCFGFAALEFERKFRLKHSVPAFLKRGAATVLARSACWKWESSQGALARLAALADVHERSQLNYFLVQGPVNYLQMDVQPDWDESLQEMIERTAAACGHDYSRLSYRAKATIRQLLYVNGARWAAKALSVGESLGQRVVYPFLWRDVLVEQGKLPWSAKVHGGIVKWPLKRLLEEQMPAEFVYRKKSGFVPPFVYWLTDPDFNDKVHAVLSARKAVVAEILPSKVLTGLLSDARNGARLRSPILATLWGALFVESWIQAHGKAPSEMGAGSS